jgi:cell division septal protein FtsQ
LQVQGFPTLLYGDPSLGGILLEEYHGETTYEALFQFANTTLSHPTCSLAQRHACHEDTQQQMSNYMAMSDTELDELIQEQDKVVESLEQDLAQRFDQMQEAYNQLAEQKEDDVARYKMNLKMLRAVQEQQQQQQQQQA